MQNHILKFRSSPQADLIQVFSKALKMTGTIVNIFTLNPLLKMYMSKSHIIGLKRARRIAWSMKPFAHWWLDITETDLHRKICDRYRIFSQQHI